MEIAQHVALPKPPPPGPPLVPILPGGQPPAGQPPVIIAQPFLGQMPNPPGPVPVGVVIAAIEQGNIPVQQIGQLVNRLTRDSFPLAARQNPFNYSNQLNGTISQIDQDLGAATAQLQANPQNANLRQEVASLQAKRVGYLMLRQQFQLLFFQPVQQPVQQLAPPLAPPPQGQQQPPQQVPQVAPPAPQPQGLQQGLPPPPIGGGVIRGVGRAIGRAGGFIERSIRNLFGK